MRTKWRDQASPVVAGIVSEVGIHDPDALCRALRAAYPFGERLGAPYQAWLAEITDQLDGKRIVLPESRQLDLFASRHDGPVTLAR